MAYPGDGYTMSNYGHNTYTAEQTKEQCRESCTRERRICEGQRTAREARGESGELDTGSSLSANYFNTRKTHAEVTSYDRSFNTEEGYDQKLKRDDLQHTQGLDVLGEESEREVPVLSNSVYGHRPPLETPDRHHVRVGLVKREFYRTTGTNMGQN